MDEIWSFVSAEDNRETLALIGGGLVTLISGIWIAARTYLGRKSGGGGVTAKAGMAAGRDMSIENSTITIAERTPVPKIAWALVAAGVLMLGYAITQMGETVCMGVSAGSVEGSNITIKGADVTC